MFSCEFCEISKNNYFYRTPLVAASDAVNNAWSSTEETLDFAGKINPDVILPVNFTIDFTIKVY